MAKEMTTRIRRGDPRFHFTPSAWAGGLMRFDGRMDIEAVAISVTKATYLAGLRRTHLHGHLLGLSQVHIAAVLVASFADQVCPGSRPAGAGDLLAAAAARAERTPVTMRRSALWGRGIADAVEAILSARDEEAAVALLTDIMLLGPEVIS